MLVLIRFFIFLQIAVVFSSYADDPIFKVPLEAYGKLPNKSMVVISPSSERIAYRDTSLNHDIMVVIDLTKKNIISRVNIEGVKPTNAYFLDENLLIFVAEENQRIWGYLGDHNISAAFAFNIETQKIHQLLVPGKGIHIGQTQVGRILSITPDRRFAIMPAYKHPGAYNLYKVDLSRGRNPKLYKKGTVDTIDFFLNTSAEVVARERYNNTKDLHRIESYIDGDWVEIFSQQTPFMTKSFRGLTPDQQSLVMISQNQENGRWAYYTMALADGKISGPIFSHDDKDVERVLSDINRTVHGVQYSGFTPTYEFFNPKINARIRGIYKALPKNTFAIRDYTPDWKAMIFYMDGEKSSGDYLLYKDGTLDLIASARSEIPPFAVHPVTQYTYKARDGMDIPSIVTLPSDIEPKNLPAILLPHGGPASYDRLGFNWMTQYFANQGFVVIQPQYRGSKGFGPVHLAKGRGEWGRKMQDDLSDAVLDLIAKGTIAKDSVCIVGASYGGYAALAGAAFTPDLYQCAVAINGVSDIELMLKTEKKNFGKDHWVVSYWQDIIAKGDVKEDHLHQISPINHVDKIRIPMLIIHGEKDKIVSIRQSEDMVDELQDADKQVTFIELEDGDHHLSKMDNRLRALKEIELFVKKYI